VVKAGLAIIFMNFAAKSTPDEVMGEPRVGDCDEVARYLRLPEIPLQTPSRQDQDILHWWKQHSSEFPNLSKMARQFLAAPASPASAERLFSADGKMHNDLKKSTSEDTLEDILTMAKNSRRRDRCHRLFGVIFNLYALIFF